MFRCIDCKAKFDFDFIGRPPVRCPKCREKVKEAWRKKHKKEK